MKVYRTACDPNIVGTKLCECGCGETITARNSDGPVRYKKGHSSRINCHLTNLRRYENNNPMWRGNNVGYDSLHQWVRNHFPKPELCQMCKKVPPYDLANLGIYNRDFSNWAYYCRKCHMVSDGRLDRLTRSRRQNK